MVANGFCTWFRRLWLPALIVLVGLVIVAVMLWPQMPDDQRGDDRRKKMLRRFEETRSKYRDDLRTHKTKMRQRREELGHIKKIPDKRERLDAMAEYGRKGKS